MLTVFLLAALFAVALGAWGVDRIRAANRAFEAILDEEVPRVHDTTALDLIERGEKLLYCAFCGAAFRSVADLDNHDCPGLRTHVAPRVISSWGQR